MPSKPAQSQKQLRQAIDQLERTAPREAVQRARSLRQAEHVHIKAKYTLKAAELNLHQVSRKHGRNSVQAARAAHIEQRARFTLAGAAGDLYAVGILTGKYGS